MGHEVWKGKTEVLSQKIFNLEGTLVEDELSSWYTWDYLGKKRISFDESIYHGDCKL